jgi:hypothetical protein
MNGRINIGLGLIFMGGFMLFGFVLVYLRDFAPDAAAWAASYGEGKHFEARLAHVHGNLFALLNILVGWLLLKFPLNRRKMHWISGLALSGMMMPVGILAELILGAPPVFVLLGALAMTVSIFWTGIEILKLKGTSSAKNI